MIVYKLFRVEDGKLRSLTDFRPIAYPFGHTTESELKLLCFKNIDQSMRFGFEAILASFHAEIWECETSDIPRPTPVLMKFMVATDSRLRNFWRNPDKYISEGFDQFFTTAPEGTMAVSNITPVRPLYRKPSRQKLVEPVEVDE